MGEQKVQARMLKLDEENKTLRGLLASLNVLRKGLDAGDVEFTPMSEDQKIPEFSFEQYEEPKPDKPIFSYDQPAPQRSEVPIAPVEEKPHFVIPPDQDVFEKDGVVYIGMVDWIHVDKGCFGKVYCGDDATCMCGKCGEKHNFINWHIIEPQESSKKSLKVTECNSAPDEKLMMSLPIQSVKWYQKFFIALDEMCDINN